MRKRQKNRETRSQGPSQCKAGKNDRSRARTKGRSGAREERHSSEGRGVGAMPKHRTNKRARRHRREGAMDARPKGCWRIVEEWEASQRKKTVTAALRAIEKEAQSAIGREGGVCDATILGLREYLREQETSAQTMGEEELFLEKNSLWMGTISSAKPAWEAMLCCVARRIALPLPDVEDYRHVWTFATGPKGKAGEIAFDWQLCWQHPELCGGLERFIAYPENLAKYRRKRAAMLAKFVTDAWCGEKDCDIEMLRMISLETQE